MELTGLAWAAGLRADDGHVPRVGFDATVPNVARIYDYLLGGKDNFAADRDAAGELCKVLPDVAVACRHNREFLRRAVRYLADQEGIGQFIDIGSGLPTASNTHEIAQAARPGARVVYADNDPVVVAHGQALLGSSPDVAVIYADLRRPGVIVGSPLLGKLVDFAEPVAFLLVTVLHFIHDGEDPYGIVGVLRSVMAPGSFLVISHVTQDGVSDQEYEGGVSVYEKASAPVIPRRYSQVAKFFDGMDLIDPGLVNVSQWRTDSQPTRPLIYGGAARKRLSPPRRDPERCIPLARHGPARRTVPHGKARSATGGVADRAACRRAGARQGSVPVAGLLVCPGTARRAVPALDVGQAPLDLGGGVGLPVRAGARHLRAWHRLRNAKGT